MKKCVFSTKRKRAEKGRRNGGRGRTFVGNPVYRTNKKKTKETIEGKKGGNKGDNLLLILPSSSERAKKTS